MKTTSLYPKHLNLNAKFAEFAGFLMPLQYQGVVEEHKAVRERCGVFDVSHMGRVEIAGRGAASLLDFLSVSPIAHLPVGSVRYTVWCDPEGGALDDLLLYRTGEETFFAVFNAANREKDWAHLLHHARGKEVVVTPQFEQEGILAVQGPATGEIFPLKVPEKGMRAQRVEYKGVPIWVATTGYTGSGGVECFAPHSVLSALWDDSIARGAVPIGLAARDTLRLEKGYALYGHELSPAISPLESVSGWTFKGEEREFIGKEQAIARKKRSAHGIVLEKGIAREGAAVWQGEKKRGEVTSGTFSPCLKTGIALILVDGALSPGEELEVEIRGRREKAKVASLPFV